MPPPTGVVAAGGPAAAFPAVLQPHSGASYEWGVATQAPGIAALDHNGTAQLSTVSCAVNGGCSAGGTYTDGTAKTSQRKLGIGAHDLRRRRAQHREKRLSLPGLLRVAGQLLGRRDV